MKEFGNENLGAGRTLKAILSGVVVVLGVLALSCNSSTRLAELPGSGDDEGQVVVYRDVWGVPHIYSPDVEGGFYAVGWSQAQDRPEELLRNFLRGMGRVSRAEGARGIASDVRAHLWDLYTSSQNGYDSIDPIARKHLSAFVQGVNGFYRDHPEMVPDWWIDEPVNEFMVVAFARLFLYSWSFDQAYAELRRSGVDAGLEPAQRASNQWAVSSIRSAERAPILLIDPHLSWLGPSRFWEFRVHAGDWVGSGFTLPGVPYIGLGHNSSVAWAMTTGGPDTADVYELTLQDGDPPRYLYDGEWREVSRREITLEIRGGSSRTVLLWSSHHGPIIGWKDNKAYAARSAYAEVVDILNPWRLFNFAEDYTGIVEGLETQNLFPQNVMVADTSGNIYYQRTGRVPVRPAGPDWGLPVDGSTSKTEWKGIHPPSDLIQILNPEQGYMQNCNIAPDAMIVGKSLDFRNFPDYIFGAEPGGLNPRGARALQVLHQDSEVTIAKAQDYTLDVVPFAVDGWLALLRQADRAYSEKYAGDSDYLEAIEDLLSWNGELRRDSTAALKYVYWKEELSIHSEFDALREAVEDYSGVLSGTEPSTGSIGEARLQLIAEALVSATRRIKADFGTLQAAYGDRFRVGRGEQSWPSGGGGDRRLGTSTLRNVRYGPTREDNTQWGVHGQSATQLVVLTRPIQSWSLTPLGQSDVDSSPHYSDQARELFSPRQLKPTWWQPGQLREHIRNRTVLAPVID